MVTIKKKQIGKQTYYYLEHTFRHKGEIWKKERYLGKKLPENIEEFCTGIKSCSRARNLTSLVKLDNIKLQ
jgi:hypothetical protein